MYQLEPAEFRGIRIYRVRGQLDTASDREIDAEVIRRCRDEGVRCVVIDIGEATNRLSVIENHEAARSFRQRIGDSLDAVAIVDRDEHRARSEMFEVTAVNRGAKLRFFESMTEACEWLVNQRSSPLARIDP